MGAESENEIGPNPTNADLDAIDEDPRPPESLEVLGELHRAEDDAAQAAEDNGERDGEDGKVYEIRSGDSIRGRGPKEFIADEEDKAA